MPLRLALLVLFLTAPICCLRAAASEPPETFVICDFEAQPTWRRLSGDGRPTGDLCVQAAESADGAFSLSVPVEFPGTMGAGAAFWTPKPDPAKDESEPPPLGTMPRGGVPRKTAIRIGAERDDAQRAALGRWHPFTHLLLKVYVPEDAPQDVQIGFYLLDGNLRYYSYFRATALPRGVWTSLALDLTSTSRHWKPAGHGKVWDGYRRQDVNEIGVQFTSRRRWTGAVLVDAIRIERREASVPKTNAIHNLHENAARIGRFELFELSFNLARTYSNPFDPEVVDARAHFICPDGTQESAPAFFYQGYQRRRKSGVEHLTPIGRSQWRVRYAPRQIGTYHYYITVKDDRSIRSATMAFRSVPSTSRGFVHMSKKDPNYFAFDNGEFYYPVGHNIAAVRDKRAEKMGVYLPDGDGTYAYDRMLARMGEAGENFGRLWMSPWSMEIEWTKDYSAHFSGLGRYSQLNAWRLDHVVETAGNEGVYLMLLLASHGEITAYESNFGGAQDKQGRMRPEQGSPYWSVNGGPLVGNARDAPNKFYTDPVVLKYYKNLARYVAARWGYSPAIMSWEMLNEPDLHQAFRNERSGSLRDEFGRTCAAFVKALILEFEANDPAHHLATTGLWKHASAHTAAVMQVKELDFFAAHVFQANLPAVLLQTSTAIAQLHKLPVFVTEADISPFPRGADVTLRSIRMPMWSSFMTPQSGAACPWWWVLIDRKDAYHIPGALAAFAQGEDRRGQNYQPMTVAVTRNKDDRRALQAMALGNAGRAFCWVYDPAVFQTAYDVAAERTDSTTISLTGLKDGAYTVEVWDTRKGQAIGSKLAQSRGGTLKIALPPFAQDVACKFYAHTGPIPSAPPPKKPDGSPDTTPKPPPLPE
jgi:uncharacterized protein DUF5060